MFHNWRVTGCLAVTTGPLKVFGYNRGLFFYIGVTSASFFNTITVVLFVYRYVSLLDESWLHRWLSQLRTAALLLPILMLIPAISMVVPLVLAVWDISDIKVGRWFQEIYSGFRSANSHKT